MFCFRGQPSLKDMEGRESGAIFRPERKVRERNLGEKASRGLRVERPSLETHFKTLGNPVHVSDLYSSCLQLLHREIEL